MKKILIIVTLALMMVSFDSCRKNKYCQCYAFIDGEDISLGDDLDIESMTEEQLEALEAKYKYNLYVIEHGNCSDKAKEIVGWGGHITCKEVDPKDPDGTWFERLFDQLLGGSHNNNNNNNSGNNGKP